MGRSVLDAIRKRAEEGQDFIATDIYHDIRQAGNRLSFHDVANQVREFFITGHIERLGYTRTLFEFTGPLGDTIHTFRYHPKSPLDSSVKG